MTHLKSKIPFGDLWLVGLGTVYGTMILTVSFLGVSHGPEFLPSLVLVGIIGAAAVTAVAALPALIVWKFSYATFRCAGQKDRAAMIAAACLVSFLASLLCLSLLFPRDAVLHIRFFALPIVSVTCTVLTAFYVFPSEPVDGCSK